MGSHTRMLDEAGRLEAILRHEHDCTLTTRASAAVSHSINHEKDGESHEWCRMGPCMPPACFPKFFAPMVVQMHVTPELTPLSHDSHGTHYHLEA
jgi:hypothetical protein